MPRLPPNIRFVKDAISFLQTALKAAESKKEASFDSIIYVSDVRLNENFHATLPFYVELSNAAQKDISFYHEVSMFYFFAKTLIFSPISLPINEYSNQVTVYVDAVKKAIKRAVKSGSKNPFFLLEMSELDSTKLQSVLLGIFQEIYIPLENYECSESNQNEVPLEIQFALLNTKTSDSIEDTVKRAYIIEKGKIIARDIGGCDPERMSPKKCAEYLKSSFSASSTVKIQLIDDYQLLLKNYPLLAAVGRCSLNDPNQLPCVVKLSCVPKISSVRKKVFLVGKGITYDTGGADLKVGGAMVGMSRDKCGAAAIAGFIAAVEAYESTDTEFHAFLAFARNSIGSRAFVADEIITARSGKRVRIGNTDAEGRLVMADLLCEAVEMASRYPSIPATIFTCATLTGHVGRAYGHSAAIVPNAAALHSPLPELLRSIGETVGEPFEISRLRKEDFDFNDGSQSFVDLISANNKPSTMTDRGHQFPAAFLVSVSGLDAHGVHSAHPINFMHLDIASVAEESPLGKPTAFPIASLCELLLK